MTFGPLEFAAYLRRRDVRTGESATVRAARESSATPLAEENILRIISGPPELRRMAAGVLDAVHVFEAVAAPSAAVEVAPVRVRVSRGSRPLVLVLSSHHAVDWRLEVERGALVEAVMLAGARESTVRGAGDFLVTAIGGCYAFRPGSPGFRHLEEEVLRCTRPAVGSFRSESSPGDFTVGD
jgi:hypothetical protein